MLLKSKWSACSSNLSSMVFPFSSFVLNKKLSVENIKEKLVNCTKKEILSFSHSLVSDIERETD